MAATDIYKIAFITLFKLLDQNLGRVMRALILGNLDVNRVSLEVSSHFHALADSNFHRHTKAIFQLF